MSLLMHRQGVRARVHILRCVLHQDQAPMQLLSDQHIVLRCFPLLCRCQYLHRPRGSSRGPSPRSATTTPRPRVLDAPRSSTRERLQLLCGGHLRVRPRVPLVNSEDRDRRDRHRLRRRRCHGSATSTSTPDENDYLLDVDYFLHAPKTPALPEDLPSTRVHLNPTPYNLYALFSIICHLFYKCHFIMLHCILWVRGIGISPNI